MGVRTKAAFTDIITAYMNYVSDHKRHPISVNEFIKEHNIKEKTFHTHFKNFEDLDRKIFKRFMKLTVEMLQNDIDYINFDIKNKLLSFYYTFFELLSANGNYIKTIIDINKNELKPLKSLKGLKKEYKIYIKALNIEIINLGLSEVEQIQKTILEEVAWYQLLFTMNFWLNDSSKSYEKTDILIEKLINTSIDFMNVQPINNLIDLGKFLIKEKIR